VNAAAEMQHDIGAHPALLVQGQHLAIRIGCHYGPVVLENRDIFGAHRAHGEPHDQPGEGRADHPHGRHGRAAVARVACVTRQIDVTTVRGHAEELELFEVLWQQEDATSMLHRSRWTRAPDTGRSACACATWAAVPARRGKESLTLGRADDNDIVVKGNLISRIHARVEMARNKVLLVDQSTNGSFVTTQDARKPSCAATR